MFFQEAEHQDLEDLPFLDSLPNTKQANNFVLSLGCKFTI